MTFVQEKILNKEELEEGEVPYFLAAANHVGLLGHEKAEGVLLESYKSGRLPHAWMFCGAKGVGKATMAYRFARFLLKEGGDSGGNGGLFGEDLPPISLFVGAEDATARHVAFGSHGGLLTIARPADAKGKIPKDIKVKDVRKIGGFLHKTAADGGWRVVIVDEAEKMNRASQNALLKMLEEPPKKTVIILVVERLGGLVPTIRSRCRLLDFEVLADENMRALLEDTYPSMAKADCDMLIELSGGSFGRACQLYEKDGLKIHRQVIDLLGELPRLNLSAVQKFVDKINTKRKDNDPDTSWQLVTESFLWWLKTMAMGEVRGLPASMVAKGGNIRALLVAKNPLFWLDAWAETGELFETCNHAYLDRRAVLISAFQKLQA